MKIFSVILVLVNTHSTMITVYSGLINLMCCHVFAKEVPFCKNMRKRLFFNLTQFTKTLPRFDTGCSCVRRWFCNVNYHSCLYCYVYVLPSIGFTVISCYLTQAAMCNMLSQEVLNLFGVFGCVFLVFQPESVSFFSYFICLFACEISLILNITML